MQDNHKSAAPDAVQLIRGLYHLLLLTAILLAFQGIGQNSPCSRIPNHEKVPVTESNEYREVFQREKLPAIDEVLAQAVKLDLFSGCVLIARGDEVLFEKAYGEANKDWQIANTPDTRFNIASGTKPFTGVAIMMLVEEGRVNLNDPVSKYLPDFPFGDSITLFHCLTHTSGLGHYTDEYTEKMHTIRGFDALLQQFIYKEKLLFEPGSRYSYSNSGVVVLGAIIEKVSGMEYGEFLQTRIFDPLEMHHTCWKMPEEVIEKRASGYIHTLSGGYLETSLLVSPPTSATGLRTTVGDLHLFLRGIASNRLLKEESREIMLTPFMMDDLGPYALLWYAYDSTIVTHEKCRVVGHYGGQPGFRAFYMYYTDIDLSVIVLSNYETNMYIPATLEKILFGKPLSLPKPSVAKLLYREFRGNGFDYVSEHISEILAEDGLSVGHPGILNDAGYTLVREGNLTMAIDFLRLNVQLFPGDANGYDSLGEVYLLTRDTVGAKRQYLKALEVDPGYGNAENARKIIRSLQDINAKQD